MENEYFTEFCWHHNINLNSYFAIDHETMNSMNYNFGIPFEKMQNKPYSALPEIFSKNTKISELEKDIDLETEEILNLKKD